MAKSMRLENRHYKGKPETPGGLEEPRVSRSSAEDYHRRLINVQSELRRGLVRGSGFAEQDDVAIAMEAEEG